MTRGDIGLAALHEQNATSRSWTWPHSEHTRAVRGPDEVPGQRRGVAAGAGDPTAEPCGGDGDRRDTDAPPSATATARAAGSHRPQRMSPRTRARRLLLDLEGLLVLRVLGEDGVE